MPYSYQTFSGGAAGLSLTISIPFLLRAHISLYTDYNSYNGTYIAQLVEGTDYDWVSDTLITMLTATTGRLVTVKRKTPTTALLVGWTDGSNVDMDDLLTADRQNLYAVQEQEDSSVQQIANSAAILDSVADTLPYLPVGTVAAIPATPTNGQRIEIGNSTGIQSFSPLTGRPIGFVGASTLPVRLVYTTTGDTWQWVDYRAVDPDNRYAGINFTQSGTGAIARTVASKLRERVSVKDFGAVGDGVTDDSAAIQAVFNAVFPRGTIVFPEGVYYVNNRIYITGAGTQGGIELVGEGGTGAASELRAGTGISNGSMVTFVDSDCGVRNIYFNANTATNATALEFQGDNNNAREYVKDCIFTSWENGTVFRTDSYTVSGCYSIGCNNFVVGANWAMNANITDNYVLGGRRSVWLRKDYTAASPQQAEGVRIVNNCFLNTAANALCIDIQSALETLIEGNIIDQTGAFGVGVNLQPVQSGDAISYTKIHNNWICAGNGSTGACIVGDSSLAGTDVSRVWISQNTLLTALSSPTGNKPAVYLNLVNTYWLLNNSVFTGTTVPLFLTNSCFNGLHFGNHSRMTADATVTTNTLNSGLNFTNSYSLLVNGTQYETTSATGVKTFKSAAGGTISFLTYNGTPEGNVTANPGSLCMRTDSGQLYVKQGTGTGNTGWVLK